ncbi:MULTISPECIES: hypothetical protein [unclassified Streptomyces]|uniref:hypothetical protein n=1 Tax=unclassified Streptomyces TaxID=2593676 RepID=UPI0038148967
MSVVPPAVAALVGLLSGVTGSTSRVTKESHGYRVTCPLPAELSDTARSDLLAVLTQADRYGHARSVDGDSVWVEIDRKAVL